MEIFETEIKRYVCYKTFNKKKKSQKLKKKKVLINIDFKKLFLTMFQENFLNIFMFQDSLENKTKLEIYLYIFSCYVCLF